uniref:Uncharacterized protein n=1 Tax=Magallana gigas TaxID=29159 RepID=A0A8W8P547_MAGGI
MAFSSYSTSWTTWEPSLTWNTSVVDGFTVKGRSSHLYSGQDRPSKTKEFQEAFPDWFIGCFIAEQNLVGVGIVCGTRGRTICHSFSHSPNS